MAEPARIIMAWSVYLDTLKPHKREAAKRDCEREWGAIPPVVEIHQGVITPVWDDDPRLQEDT